ncbi:rRNA maturation RNase YbeY [Pseudazoarcus pumilus]|uniref:Endoribonuclease YbeY n=1 Tax=Pseudazoarcus pumilus TaxID=2067960 RepID=A0A2I6S5H7_9RHOO|nr:rRNA maturation RNase YbeY [Pseudazoarcus pumilus]AUN94509.1 rRNA maturation RNase YbeY [Pseudazoarcus pumilus]
MSSTDTLLQPTRPTLALTVQRALRASEREGVPRAPDLRRWARAALRDRSVEAAVRIVGEDEGRVLNRDYRKRDYATNVLTFVYDDAPVPGMPLFGDIVLCAPVVVREAREQGKPLDAHFAHLMVHAMLHLQGFDHETASEAEEMETLETAILATLGYGNPYT